MKKQLVKNMISPITGGNVYLVEDTEIHIFRGEEYTVNVQYYVCEDTGEEFTTEKQDNLLCNDLYGQYYQRHGIKIL